MPSAWQWAESRITASYVTKKKVEEFKKASQKKKKEMNKERARRKKSENAQESG